MPLCIVRDDLPRVQAEALVVPANEELTVEGGAGFAVAQAAGLQEVREACQKIGWCQVGHAVATPAYGLDARFIIHAVGPVWVSGTPDAEKERLLRSAYDSALALAIDLECASVALPLLSAGTFGCPAETSLRIATAAARDLLERDELAITLVVYDPGTAAAASRHFPSIQAYIDDVYVDEHRMRASSSFIGELYRREAKADADAMYRGAMPSSPAASAGAGASRSKLDDLLENLDAGFSETLLHLIDESGRTDAQVYKRANMSRQLFSKICSNPDYRPTKRTAVALCVALELTLEQTEDLLARAGYALSRSSMFDVIVEWFISNGIYDFFEINEVLYAKDQQLLG